MCLVRLLIGFVNPNVVYCLFNSACYVMLFLVMLPPLQ